MVYAVPFSSFGLLCVVLPANVVAIDVVNSDKSNAEFEAAELAARFTEKLQMGSENTNHGLPADDQRKFAAAVKNERIDNSSCNFSRMQHPSSPSPEKHQENLRMFRMHVNQKREREAAKSRTSNFRKEIKFLHRAIKKRRQSNFEGISIVAQELNDMILDSVGRILP